jgi:histone H3/H4
VKRTKAPVTETKPKKVKKDVVAVEAGGDGSADVSEAKKPKVSARNITVEWKPRLEYGVRTQPYRRLLNFYAHQKLPDMRMASGVAKALQSAVEEEVVEVLRRASVVAMHAKRNTVNAQDIELQAKLVTSKSGDSEDLMAWAQKKLSKRKNAAAKSKTRKPAKAKPADGSAGTEKPKKAAAPKKAKKAKDGSVAPAGADGAAVAAPAVMPASDVATMPPMVAITA